MLQHTDGPVEHSHQVAEIKNKPLFHACTQKLAYVGSLVHQDSCSAGLMAAVPCCLTILVLENVPILTNSDQKLIDAHGGIYGNFPTCRSSFKQCCYYKCKES